MEMKKYKYGSHTIGESKDDDIVVIVDSCESNSRTSENIYNEIKKQYSNIDLIILRKDRIKLDTKYAMYPHIDIPHIFIQCIESTTGAKISDEFPALHMQKFIKEIPLLFKTGIEAIIEGEPQKGIFKLLQFIAFQQARRSKNHAVIVDILPDMFMKSGLCKITGWNIYDPSTKCFDEIDLAHIIKEATALLGTPVVIDINKVVYIECCVDNDMDCGTIDEGEIRADDCTVDVDGETWNCRDLLKIDENKENVFSIILENANVDINRSSNIKYRAFGETRWAI